MAWNDISSSLCDIGKGLTTTLMNYIRGNLDYLKANTGTGNIKNLLTNPSFENYDPDTMQPDNWDIITSPVQGTGTVVVEESNNSNGGAARLKFSAVPAALLNKYLWAVSSFLEIDRKKLLRWKIRVNPVTGTPNIKVKIYFYKGDQTAGTVTPDVNGSSYPQPGELPENAYGVAGAGYAEWPGIQAILIPSGSASAQYSSMQGIVQPPSDACWAKIEIEFYHDASYEAYMDSVEVYQPDFDDRDYISASANLKMSLDTEKSSTSTSYVKAKEFRVYQHGIYTVKFSLKTGTVGAAAYGRIYKNGVAYGTEQSDTTGSYVVKSEDLEFGQGDTIELWIKATSPRTAYVDDFQLYFDEAKVYGYGKDIL